MTLTGTSRGGKIAALIGCTLMLSIVYMSLTSWSVAVNELARDFDLSPIMIQMGSSSLIAGYAIGSFVSGKWVASFGWRRTFTGIIIAFLIASALIPIVSSYWIILVLRFVQGWGCMVVVTSAIVSSWFPTKERGLALGILLGAIGLGSALGGYLSGVLNPILGWRNTFWLITAVTLVGVIIFYALVREAPPLEEEAAANGAAATSADTTSIYRDPRLWLLGIATFCGFFNVYGMYAYLAQYLFTIEFTSAQVGTIVFLNGFIAVFSTPIGGWISDRLVGTMGPLKARTFTNSWVAFMVGAVGCALIPHLAPLGFGLAILAALIAGWGGPATNGPGLSLPSDLLGSAAAGPGVGLVLLIAGAGGIIAPIWVPSLAQSHGWTLAWYVTAGAAVLGVIVNIVLGRSGDRARTKAPAIA
ncbi:MAG: MFS transporter [Brooklawnia sp.]|jgi:MFS family permease